MTTPAKKIFDFTISILTASDAGGNGISGSRNSSRLIARKNDYFTSVYTGYETFSISYHRDLPGWLDWIRLRSSEHCAEGVEGNAGSGQVQAARRIGKTQRSRRPIPGRAGRLDQTDSGSGKKEFAPRIDAGGAWHVHF